MSPTILVVDDENDLREAIAFDFRRNKFNVLMAASGQEAIKIVESHKVDIVLTDVRMPNGDGVELLDQIKEKNAFLPVVMFITGFADISLEEAYDKGAEAVFAKPFDRKVLLEAVQRAIQPLEQRFSRKNSRTDVEIAIGLKFLKSNFSTQTTVKNLGRGGFFVSLNEKFPEALECAEFRMNSVTEPKIIVTGEGIVRWVRRASVDHNPSGCGIEFKNLENKSMKQVIELINFQKTKSFIPIN